MTETMKVSSIRMKVIMLGDSGVGKTSLITRFIEGSFDNIHKSGIQEFRTREVDVSGVKIKLQIWDTNGQECYRRIPMIYYRGIAGIVMVFDLTRKSSFDNIQYWLQQVHEHAGENVDIVLVGNKVDLAESRVIDHETASSLAQTIGAMYVECSARTDVNVDLIYNSLASKWVNRVPVHQEEPLRLESGTFYQVPCFGKDTCSSF